MAIATKQGLESYETRTKKQYRGWVFNRVSDLLEKPKNEANIIYLCGPDDYDRPIAEWKGFDKNRMLAVDVSPKCVKALRASGATAYQGDLASVILNYNGIIDVIHADFCCGLTGSALKLIHDVILSPNIPGRGIVSVNMQRGREWWRDMKDFRPVFREYGFGDRSDSELFEVMKDSPHGVGWTDGHRGKIFHKVLCMSLACYIKYELSKIGYKSEDGHPDIDDPLWLHFCEYRFRERTKAQFYTYKSKKVSMDSVVFRMPDASQKHHANDITDDDGNKVFNCDKKVMRKLSAAKAVQTMRRNGTKMGRQKVKG